MNKNKLMMIIFIGSEAFFFIGLIISYVYYTHSGTGASRASYLDIGRTLIFTAFLIASSFTVAIAGHKLKKGKRQSLKVFLLTTIVFGMVFLIGQGTEYAHLIGLDVTISKDIFGSAFFTLTGFHGLHVLIGLIVLSIMFAVISSRKYEPVEPIAFECVSIYWHFVDAVWIAVFSAVYIGAII